MCSSYLRENISFPAELSDVALSDSHASAGSPCFQMSKLMYFLVPLMLMQVLFFCSEDLSREQDNEVGKISQRKVYVMF